MSYTVFDALLIAYGSLGKTYSVSVDDASTTTVVKIKDGDTEREGYLFIKRTPDGLAPQGEYSIISSKTTTQMTVSDAFSAIPAENSTAVVCLGYQIDFLKEYINVALQDIGLLPVIDESLTYSSDTKEYSIPVAVKNSEVNELYWLNSDGDVYPVKDFEVTRTTVNVSDKLRIRDGNIDDGATLRIVYFGQHPQVWDNTDIIHDTITEPVLRASIRKAVITFRYNQQPQNDTLIQQYNAANSEYNVALANNPIPTKERKSRKMVINRRTR